MTEAYILLTFYHCKMNDAVNPSIYFSIFSQNVRMAGQSDYLKAQPSKAKFSVLKLNSLVQNKDIMKLVHVIH